MANPPAYSRDYSFSSFQANSPQKPLPGNKVDEELDNIGSSVNAAITGLADIRREDGRLRNGIVTAEALAPNLSTGVDPAELWTAGKQYFAGNTVAVDTAFYRCVQGHISTVFDDDLVAGYWVKYFDIGGLATDAETARDQAVAAAGTATAAASAAAGAATDVETARNEAVAAAGTATSAASTASGAAGAATTAAGEAEAARDETVAAAAGKMDKAANLSDVANASAARGNLGLGNSAVRNVGTSPGTVAAGDDARLSDTRTPTDGTVTDAKLPGFDILTSVSAAKLRFAQAGTGVVARSVEAELRERISITQFGAVGDFDEAHASQNVAALRAAIARVEAMGGGDVVIPPGYFFLSERIELANSSVRIIGTNGSAVCATASFGHPSLFRLSGTNNVIDNLRIDCGSVSGAGQWVSGVYLDGSWSYMCRVENCTIVNASFCGIWCDDHEGTVNHYGLVIRNNRIMNVGWHPISLTGTQFCDVVDNYIERAGYSGIMLYDRCLRTSVCDNFVTKATPPYRIYNGPGSLGGVEGGFLIGYAPSCEDTLIDGNICVDNRNAAQDGIGLGEDGTEHGSAVISNNIVYRAGLFGIDVAASATITGNVIEEAAQSGIFIALDLGGSISSSIITGNVIRNTNGAYGINLSANMGNPMSVADLLINGNVIVDYRGTPATQYGIRLRRTDVTLLNVVVSNNIAVNVGSQGLLVEGTGPDVPIRAHGNTFKAETRSVTGGGFYCEGANTFFLTNGSATQLNQITGGWHGKEILVTFGDSNTTLKPDVSNSLGLGTNRIIGNGNAERAMANGDGVILRYYGDYAWLIVAIIDIA